MEHSKQPSKRNFKIPYLSLGFAKLSFTKLLARLKSDMWLWVWWLLFSSAVLFIILWLPNLELLFNVLGSGLSFSAKLDFLATTPEFLRTAYPLPESILLVTLSLLQGLLLALIVRQWQGLRSARATAGSSMATSLAIAGTGCVACGTSLIYPLFGWIGASAVGITATFSWFIMIFSILLLVYFIHYTLLSSSLLENG